MQGAPDELAASPDFVAAFLGGQRHPAVEVDSRS